MQKGKQKVDSVDTSGTEPDTFHRAPECEANMINHIQVMVLDIRCKSEPCQAGEFELCLTVTEALLHQIQDGRVFTRQVFSIHVPALY